MITQDAFPPRRREFITVDEGDPRAYGIDGLLRDGYKIRVPIEMMDSRLPIERMRSSEPLIINTGLPRSVYDGIPGITASSDARRSRKRVARDPMGREVGTYEEEDAALSAHRPGYRVGDAARGTADAGQALKDAAYEEMCRDLSTAWMSPEQRGQNGPSVSDARHATTAPARPLGVSNSDCARELNRREISDAWKSPAPALNAAPSGKWPMSAGAGSACDLNGERGVLVEDGSGFLVCQVNRHVGPTRSDAAPPRFMDAATAQKIKDAAWLESVERVSNAWKVQG
jgi:hypothetical protein